MEIRFNFLMDETTAFNNVSEFQKQVNSFDTALIHSSENVLGKKLKSKHASWVSAQTIELLNICNKAAKRYKRTRNPAHKNQWQLLQGQVSADPSRSAVWLENGFIPKNKVQLLKGWRDDFDTLLNNRNANVI